MTHNQSHARVRTRFYEICLQERDNTVARRLIIIVVVVSLALNTLRCRYNCLLTVRERESTMRFAGSVGVQCVVLVAAAFAMTTRTEAFRPPLPPPPPTAARRMSMRGWTTSRQGFVQEISGAASALLLLLVSSPPPAAAAVNVESVVATSRASGGGAAAAAAALRRVKAAQTLLRSDAVAQYIAAADYPALQAALRAPPMSEIRKAGVALVRQSAASAASAAANGATAGTPPPPPPLEPAYKAFITAVEQLDTTALNAIRGRTLRANEFQTCYESVLSTLAAFVVAAERSAAVPIATASPEY